VVAGGPLPNELRDRVSPRPSLGGDGSLMVLLLLLLLQSLVSPATCSSPAVVYPCRSGDVQRQREEGDAGWSPIRSSEASNPGLVSSRARG
jgi:hypothetical protein